MNKDDWLCSLKKNYWESNKMEDNWSEAKEPSGRNAEVTSVIF